VRFEILIDIRQLQKRSDIGSVVPHPLLGYIWVTLGREKAGTSEKGRAQLIPKSLADTVAYVKAEKSQVGARKLFDALIT
jgi:hypothetical protein